MWDRWSDMRVAMQERRESDASAGHTRCEWQCAGGSSRAEAQAVQAVWAVQAVRAACAAQRVTRRQGMALRGSGSMWRGVRHGGYFEAL